ncbi:hypothetical protein DSECCO2_372790 [anaerobic digester metagenome]
MALLAGIGAITSLFAGLIGGISLAGILGVASSTAIIEYGAAAVAVGIGIPPLPAMGLVFFSGLTLILLLFAVLDTLAERSAVVRRLVERAQRRTRTIAWLQRYGPVALVPAVVVVGFYICVPVAWFLGWRRYPSIAALSMGFLLATAGTTAISAGLHAAL